MTDNQNTRPDLLPCPFCGSDDLLVLKPTCHVSTPHNENDRMYPLVRCKSCHAEVPGKNNDGPRDNRSAQSAFDAWNTRAVRSLMPEAKPWHRPDYDDLLQGIIDIIGNEVEPMGDIEGHEWLEGTDRAAEKILAFMPEANGWRDISTAPKGEEIFAYREDAGWFQAIWGAMDVFPLSEREIDGIDEDTFWHESWWGFGYDGVFRLEDDLEPTHWTTAPTPAPDPVKAAADDFDRQDYYYRDYDPDDSGDNPGEALRYVPLLCVSLVHSSTRGPSKFCFRAETLDQDDDEEETLCFDTEQEALDAAKERDEALRALQGEA